MITDKHIIRLLKLEADERIANLRSQIHDAKTRIEVRSKELDKWQQIADATKGVVCLACEGHGQIREWEAQDSSRIVVCSACKGTGIA